MAEEVVVRFDEVTFEYVEKKKLLDEASFSMRKGSKVTLMGQNGAGKSTLFSLLTKKLKPKSGTISTPKDTSIATALQTINKEDYPLTIEEYFKRAFEMVPVGIKSDIAKAMDAVNLTLSTDKKLEDLSGGQRARLLLAFALIQKPDILLLDEPTNNLDQEGIDHLVTFLIMYEKTVIVISHDAAFLNSFTDGVLYLDAHTKKLEMYKGDYFSVIEEIETRMEKERRKNAQLEKIIQDRKDKANFFSHKGGKMRKLAKKMKDETEEMEDNKVTVRRDDKTIRDFSIPVQEDLSGTILEINSVSIMQDHEQVEKKVEKKVTKKMKLLISGPNGIGKTTLLKNLVENKTDGAHIQDSVRVGYYSQDFATLNYNETVMESLTSVVSHNETEQEIRSIAAGFLLSGDLMVTKVGHLSEGQKGLLSFARLILLRPGILILDEPTNHINFRHLPVIAKAVDAFEGPIILISHMQEFVDQITIEDYLDLASL